MALETIENGIIPPFKSQAEGMNIVNILKSMDKVRKNLMLGPEITFKTATTSGVTEQCGALSQSSGSGPLFFANHVYRLRLPLTA